MAITLVSMLKFNTFTFGSIQSFLCLLRVYCGVGSHCGRVWPYGERCKDEGSCFCGVVWGSMLDLIIQAIIRTRGASIMQRPTDNFTITHSPIKFHKGTMDDDQKITASAIGRIQLLERLEIPFLPAPLLSQAKGAITNSSMCRR